LPSIQLCLSEIQTQPGEAACRAVQPVEKALVRRQDMAVARANSSKSVDVRARRQLYFATIVSGSITRVICRKRVKRPGPAVCVRAT
jgi:hypothetical protein